MTGEAWVVTHDKCYLGGGGGGGGDNGFVGIFCFGATICTRDLVSLVCGFSFDNFHVLFIFYQTPIILSQQFNP